MCAYVIFDVEIRDMSKYQEFMKGVKPALDAAELARWQDALEHCRGLPRQPRAVVGPAAEVDAAFEGDAEEDDPGVRKAFANARQCGGRHHRVAQPVGADLRPDPHFLALERVGRQRDAPALGRADLVPVDVDARAPERSQCLAQIPGLGIRQARCHAAQGPGMEAASPAIL
mgnify:CR=1 FL=1